MRSGGGGSMRLGLIGRYVERGGGWFEGVVCVFVRA